MTQLRLRRALLIILALASVAAVLGAVSTDTAKTVHPIAAADLSQFTAGNIISDQVFSYTGSMSATDIQNFLAAKEASCVAGSDGSPCLKDFRQDTATRAADAQCPGTYTGASQELASTIIAKVAQVCGINPQVLIVMLQKEQGLVTGSGGTALSTTRYNRAMGYGCPDTPGGCDAAYFGFSYQVYMAAHQMRRYAMYPDNYNYKAGVTRNILYNPNTACGSSPVYLQNQATADLYNYTPYQPNAAALASANGDACSAFGNRNFWMYFTDWFGTTQVINWPQSVAFVKALYNDVLHRAPSADEVNSWAMQVALHPDHSWVPAQFLYSTEQLQVMVDGVYEAALKRHADPGGLANWVRYFQSGTTLNEMNAGIYGSQEALNALGGGDVSQWVDGMYMGLLGRHAAPSERTYWAGVAAGQGRVAVSYAISTSVEARSLRVNGYYVSLLQRNADPAGVRTWVPMLLGRGDLDVQAMIINSQEYWNNASVRFPS